MELNATNNITAQIAAASSAALSSSPLGGAPQSIVAAPAPGSAELRDEVAMLEAQLEAKRRLLAAVQPQETKLAPPTPLVRIDLGSGRVPREGFDGADIADLPIKYPKLNLWEFPWPWADDSVDELHCSHHIEHIPMAYWHPDRPAGDRLHVAPLDLNAQDLLLRFFDECFRVLKHDGVMQIVVPAGQSSRAFQDPTHRRFIVPDFFFYLNRDWRRMNSLDHYNVKCHFSFNVGHTTPKDETLYHPEASARRYRHYWNVVHDHVAMIKAVKREPVPTAPTPASEKK